MEKYLLHVDQGAILENQLALVLLGLQGPDEFASELYEQLPISEQTVKDILADLNRDVFVPIREEMRKGGAAAMVPAKPAATPVSVPAAVEAPRASAPAPQMHLQNKIPPPSSPTPPVQAVPRLAPSPSVAPLPPKLVMPRVNNTIGVPIRPMLPAPSPKATEGTALGEELSASSPSVNLISRPPTPPASVAPRVPTAPVPPNLPGTNIPVPAQAPRAVPVAPKAPTPIVKQYSSDPYREPIDGK